jgi:hypothetical protein
MFRKSYSYRRDLGVWAAAATYSDRSGDSPECFACETIYFACELINFAWETILLRQAARKLLKSLGREMSDFAVSWDLKGLTTHFVSRCSFSPSFSEPPFGLASI